MNLSREYLYKRHRLSHVQIDTMLNEKESKNFIGERIERLNGVKNFIHVSDLLRDNTISFIPFKGPLLSYRIYNDASVRYCHDSDLLINIVDIEPTVNLLKKSGYNLAPSAFWPQNKIQQELLISSTKHLMFIHHETKSVVEIHWSLLNEVAISDKKFQKIIQSNLIEMEFTGRKYTVLSHELEFLLILIHGSRHAWRRLKWLIDIKDFPISKLDKDKFDDLLSQFKAKRILSQANYLLFKYYNYQLPLDTHSRLPRMFKNYPAKAIADEQSALSYSTRNILNNIIYSWFLFPGIRYKVKILSNFLFRPGDLREIDFSSKMRYYLYRPFSFIKRRVFNA